MLTGPGPVALTLMLNDTRGELQQPFCAAAGLNISTQAINSRLSLSLRMSACCGGMPEWSSNEIGCVAPVKFYF